MESDYDHLYKILLVGDSGVGKSSLLLRFTEDTFMDTFISTIGVDFKIRVITVGDKRYKLQIWDTAGQERFRTITGAYYRGAHGILIVYDVNDLRTFEHVSTWMSEITRYTPSTGSGINVRFLIGNKIDQPPEFRQVSEERGKKVAEDNGMRWMEASAKTNVQVDMVFTALTSAIHVAHLEAERNTLLQNKRKGEIEGALLLNNAPNPDGASCC